jgi:hypothetical protein
MRTPNSPVRKDVPAFAALALVVALAAPVAARADVSIYQSVVPMTAGKDAAFAEALRTTAVRASGRGDAGANKVIAAAAENPGRYVQEYSTTPDRYLKVGFDAQAIDRLLQQAGLPVWPLERPVTQVLLVAPSAGGGSRAIVAGDRVPEKAEVEKAAEARGLPVGWPRGTVPAAGVRSAIAGGGAEASAGAGLRPVLAGVAQEGSFSWRFTEGGKSVTAVGSVADGVNLAADNLAARYAPPSTRTMSLVPVRVGGVADVRAYAGLIEYLKSLSLVRGIQVAEMSEGVVSLQLALRGDLELLKRIAALDERLRAGPAGEDGSGVDFTYVP